MAIRDYLAEMQAVRDEIHEAKSDQERPDRVTAMGGFFQRARYAFRLILSEPEIIVFALLQWVFIGLGYFLWVQMLAWIPEPVWEAAVESDGAGIADIVLLLWSFVCVGLVALPVGLLSAAMGAVHFLHRQGRPANLAACLRLVLPNAWPIWVFSWVDGWWTVMRILDRLPKRNDTRSWSEKAVSEAIYQAWKMGTMGMLPAMVTGKGLIESGRQSVRFVTARFRDVAMLRLGYSGLCWVVGILAYVGAIVFLAAGPGSVNFDDSVASQMFVIYFWAGVPLVIAVGVVLLVLRPIYLISACDLYSDYLQENGKTVSLGESPSRPVSVAVSFAVLCLAVLVVFVYRDALGITEWLSTPSAGVQ